MLRIENLVFDAWGRRFFDSASVAIPSGTKVGLVGRNGADHGDGEVSMVLMLGNGNEVEVKLPGRFKVSPQIAGAIKAVTGVVTVEAL